MRVWVVSWVVDHSPPVVDGFGSVVFTDEAEAWAWAEAWERGEVPGISAPADAVRSTTVESYEIEIPGEESAVMPEVEQRRSSVVFENMEEVDTTIGRHYVDFRVVYHSAGMCEQGYVPEDWWVVDLSSWSEKQLGRHSGGPASFNREQVTALRDALTRSLEVED